MQVVVGEALMDMVPDSCDGGRGHRARPGGSPYNVALGCARLGHDTAFVGRLSTDRFGRALLAHLEDNDVDTRWVIDSDDLTSLAFVHTDDRGVAEYAFYMEGTADRGLLPSDVTDLQVDALHTGSIALLVEPVAGTVAHLIDTHRAHATISLDPNIRAQFIDDRAAFRADLEDLVAKTHVVKVSDEDLDWIAPGTDPLDVARTWLAAGPSLVVVTRGPDGADAVTGADHVRVPGQPVEVADTVGAGDSFTSALLTWLAAHGHLAALRDRAPDGDALRDMLSWCVSAAAITCSRVGADPPRRGELPA